MQKCVLTIKMWKVDVLLEYMLWRVCDIKLLKENT